ncbi:MAG: hypothetical protein JNK43_06650 [Ignavibacteria bacterium]|nr:hypothetical protein [Ignavibacteria bacterium]
MSKPSGQNSIDQEVIIYTAEYTHTSPEELNDSTVLATIGIVTEEERSAYMEEIEERFGLTYEPGDEDGIYIIGEVTTFIEKKLGEGAAAGK